MYDITRDKVGRDTRGPCNCVSEWTRSGGVIDIHVPSTKTLTGHEKRDISRMRAMVWLRVSEQTYAYQATIYLLSLD
jgi:hypothetical protein